MLRLLTHQKDMDYFDYIRNIRSNPAAKAVKLADLAHNSTRQDLPERMAWMKSSGSAGGKKYARAKAILNGEEG